MTVFFSLCKTKVNKVDFGQFTREEAANFLLNIKRGERVEICSQNKMNSKCGTELITGQCPLTHNSDSWPILNLLSLQSTRRSLSPTWQTTSMSALTLTMKQRDTSAWASPGERCSGWWTQCIVGSWGTGWPSAWGTTCTRWIKAPSQTWPGQEEMDTDWDLTFVHEQWFSFLLLLFISCRAETLASIEQSQRMIGERPVSGPRAEFWKLRGLRGNKKNEKPGRRSRDDLLQLTIQGKFPAYEKVLLREGALPSSHADDVMQVHVPTRKPVEQVLMILIYFCL